MTTLCRSTLDVLGLLGSFLYFSIALSQKCPMMMNRATTIPTPMIPRAGHNGRKRSAQMLYSVNFFFIFGGWWRTPLRLIFPPCTHSLKVKAISPWGYICYNITMIPLNQRGKPRRDRSITIHLRLTLSLTLSDTSVLRRSPRFATLQVNRALSSNMTSDIVIVAKIWLPVVTFVKVYLGELELMAMSSRVHAKASRGGNDSASHSSLL